MSLHVAVSGTPDGMTEMQKNVAALLLRKLRAGAESSWMHNGLCVGADAEFHELGRNEYYLIHGYPSTLADKRVDLACDRIEAPAPPLERNHTMVDRSTVLVATPKGMQEVRRSGTWATIRYARKRGKQVTIIYPDGSIGS